MTSQTITKTVDSKRVKHQRTTEKDQCDDRFLRNQRAYCCIGCSHIEEGHNSEQEMDIKA